MIPLRVSLEGFLSYKEKQVIDFEGSSLWMLWGPNAVGKSAIFDAIRFALYGSHRGGRSNVKELINHYSNRLVVEFDFLSSGLAYRIRRIHPRSGRPARGIFLLENDSSDPLVVHEIPVSGTESEDDFKDWVLRTIGLNELAFTSSVLLLQGKSEQLLTVEPRDRYTILAEVIDLSRYQRLHEAADAHRKNHESRVRLLSGQLAAPAMQAITEESVEAAQLEADQKDELWRTTQVEVERFTKLLEQAKQREELVTELTRKQAALQEIVTLLASEDEIEMNFQAWQALQQVLPSLRQAVEQRQHIVESQQRAKALKEQIDSLSERVLEAQGKRDEVAEQVCHLAQAIKQVQQKKEQHQHRLTELAPIIAKLEQVEDFQEQSDELQTQMRRFSPDIAQRLQEAEKRSEQLAEIDRALPWLRSFALARSGFTTSLAEQKNARRQAEALQTKLQELEDTSSQLNAQLLEAQEAERELFAAKISAHNHYEASVRNLQRFEDTAVQRVCELCGQEITEEHAAREKERFQLLLELARSLDEEKESLHQKTVERYEEYNTEFASVNAQMKEVEVECKQFEDLLRDHQNEAVSHLRQLREAFGNIQSPFREQIIAFMPAEDNTWLETIYPTDSDLQVLQDEVNRKAAHGGDLRGLRQQHNEFLSIQTQITLVEGQLTQLRETFDVAQGMRDRDEKSRIDQDLVCFEKEITLRRKDHQQAEKLSQESNENYDTLREDEKAQCTQLTAELAGQEIMTRSLRSSIETLPLDWQTQAESISTDELDQLEQKRDSLAPYKPQYEQLAYARKEKVSIEQRIDELCEQIAGYTPEASRPVEEVERELGCKKVDRDMADGERSRAGQCLAQLRVQWEQRVNLEQQKRDAERLHHLYKLLAELLGRSGLQFHLLHEAENVITDLANGTLSGLSHGRMRLELRRENEATRASTEKALDLLVYDRDTGQHAIPINHASGSQKFRIAVSLALAIGRYSNRTAHHVESVIIDEGFGSLDKSGRDDMIQELRTLGQQLARIILVSHQDDFAAAFPNRYSFKLVDKASCVRIEVND